jgi:hypothetical protein
MEATSELLPRAGVHSEAELLVLKNDLTKCIKMA